MDDPNALFSRELTRTIYGNPRFHDFELADLDKVSIDRALAFVKKCSNPGDYTFVLAGNIDIDSFRPLAESYLASIPAAEPFNQWTDVDFGRPGRVDKALYKGAEQRSLVYMSWFLPADYIEEDSIAAGIMTDYLEIVLNDQIREALGGVYSISSAVSLSPLPTGEFQAAVYFGCDPARADELAEAVIKEFREAASMPLDGDILAKAREALVKSQESSVQNNLYICQSYANSAVIYNSPLSRLDKRPALYNSVTAAQIQNTLARIMEAGDKAGPVRVTLYPEKSDAN
jgi:zinc protease